jgi:hypothetical protein
MQNGNMKSTTLSSDIDVNQPIILEDALKVQESRNLRKHSMGLFRIFELRQATSDDDHTLI